MTNDATKMSDGEVKAVLGSKPWPQATKQLWSHKNAPTLWLRAQPADARTTGPRLRIAGSKSRTQPDGLWLTFATPQARTGIPECADAIVVEACGTGQNLNDKRFRYGARIPAITVLVGDEWLDADVAVQGGGRKSRRAQLKLAAKGPMSIPVRNLRVLYALPDGLYKKVKED